MNPMMVMIIRILTKTKVATIFRTILMITALRMTIMKMDTASNTMRTSTSGPHLPTNQSGTVKIIIIGTDDFILRSPSCQIEHCMELGWRLEGFLFEAMDHGRMNGHRKWIYVGMIEALSLF